MRAERFSKLGANNKWGFFPSASTCMGAERRSFLEERGFPDQLKLRAGYGLTGNQDAIGCL